MHAKSGLRFSIRDHIHGELARTPPPTAPAHLPTGAVVLLHAPLLVPSDAAARETKPRELPQAAPSAAVPRTGVREEKQPHQRGTGRTK